MNEIWILNASPVITMAKAGYLHLFDQLAAKLLIPDAVVREILAAPPSDPARKALESGWGERASPREVPLTVLALPPMRRPSSPSVSPPAMV